MLCQVCQENNSVEQIELHTDCGHTLSICEDCWDATMQDADVRRLCCNCMSVVANIVLECISKIAVQNEQVKEQVAKDLYRRYVKKEYLEYLVKAYQG